MNQTCNKIFILYFLLIFFKFPCLLALSSFLVEVSDVTSFLPLFLPVAVARLGTQEITEPSEELRLCLVTLLSAIVSRCGVDIGPYLNDMVVILMRTIIDPFPEVKKVSEVLLLS